MPFFTFNLKREMEQLMGEEKVYENYKLYEKFLCK